MARPARPERNKAARSFRQLRRFHHVINSYRVFGTHREQQAAEKLVEAGRILAQEPQAMQLRYFEALHDIAGERSSTVVFPLPMNLFDHLGLRSEST